MNHISCVIPNYRGVSGLLKYGKDNLTKDEFIKEVAKQIRHKALTKPSLQLKRGVCLIGYIYDQLNGDTYLLDVVIEAVKLVEKLEIEK